MNRINIEIFNTIIKEGNISKAAEVLYLPTSTVSARLKVLEDELGGKLIERSKGKKDIALTPKGLAFSQIAGSMQSLYNECDKLASAESSEKTTASLTIASADSFYNSNFIDLYRELMFENSQFRFELNLYPSDMIYPLVIKKEVDIGFVLYAVNFPDVSIKPIFDDDIVIVTHKDSPYRNITNVKDLDPSREMIVGSKNSYNLGWGPEVKAWHNRIFNHTVSPLLQVNCISLLYYFFNETDYWAMMPNSVALQFVEQYPIVILDIQDDIPKRTCYEVVSSGLSQSAYQQIDLFNDALQTYIRKLPGIRYIY